MKIFPSSNERTITIAIFAFVIGLAIGLTTKIDPDKVLSALVTLLAAFFGAFYAFKLQHSKQEQILISSRVESGNKAIFNLIRAYNTFLVYRKQFIEPFINEPGRFIAIPPSIGFQGKADFDFDSLTYLFELDDPNIVGELSSIQSEVESTIDLILQRSHLHLNGVQPSLEKAGFVDGQDILKSDIEAALGHQLTEMMVQGTDQVIEFVDLIIHDSEHLIDRLHKLHMKNFRGHKILKMEKLNKSMQPTANASAD